MQVYYFGAYTELTEPTEPVRITRSLCRGYYVVSSVQKPDHISVQPRRGLVVIFELPYCKSDDGWSRPGRRVHYGNKALQQCLFTQLGLGRFRA